MIVITAIAHPVLRESFEKMGLQVLYAPDISYPELQELMPTITGLVVTTRIRVDADLLRQADKLKWIGRLGSGMELIDINFAGEKNIQCISTPEGNRNAVGEQTLGMLLGLLHNIYKGGREVASGHWLREENRGTELSGKVVGIVGFGNTGEAFAKVLSGFGVTILAYDKFRFGFGGVYVKEAGMEQLCKYADVISFHLPLTATTYHLANNEFFNSLENKPVILNTARGEIIETGALIKALQEDRISGAGLDVLENERLSTLNQLQQQELDFLSSHQRVIITPHIAGYTYEASYKMSAVLLEKLCLNNLLPA